MSLFHEDTHTLAVEKEAQSGKSAYQHLADDTYNCIINEVEVVRQQKKEFVNGFPVEVPGEEEDVIIFDIIVESPIAGGETVDVNGEPMSFNSKKFYLNPLATGFKGKDPGRGRQFICAAMGWEDDHEINLTVLEDLIVNGKFKNKEIIGIIKEYTGNDKTKKSKWDRFKVKNAAPKA